MPTELKVWLDVPVVKVPVRNGSRELKADLWIPRSSQPLPCVVYIHGGGWRGGTQYRPPFAPRLWEDQIAIAAITYRFSGEAPFPACLRDCIKMLNWLRKEGRRFGLDPDRFAGWGISAGGHLVSLLAHPNILAQHSEERDPETRPLQGVVNWWRAHGSFEDVFRPLSRRGND